MTLPTGPHKADCIVDSAISIKEALSGKVIPEAIRIAQRIIDVQYISFDGNAHAGQLVAHERVAAELARIFLMLFRLRFPIEKIIPIARYRWNDERSMAANNTSAFNYRIIHGTNRLSWHAHGLAVDINPRVNPFYAQDGSVHPVKAVYDPAQIGAIAADGPIVRLFENAGWEWGGRWHDRKDWQHFQKPMPSMPGGLSGVSGRITP